MFKLSDCITRINQALNYPAITYSDISHFFDQAISELNTTFRIALPLVSEMIEEQKPDYTSMLNVVMIDVKDGVVPEIDAVNHKPNPAWDTSKIYYSIPDNRIYKYNFATDEWVLYDTVYGFAVADNGTTSTYETYKMPYTGSCIWQAKLIDDLSLDLNVYLPTDWIILFLIPYVCYKVTVRDGGDGTLFSEEYVQGYQQLQTSYDVPNRVWLPVVAHLPAYTKIVETKLDCIGLYISTRAVYDTMKIGNAVMAKYGGFNMRGGWGI